MPVVSSTCTERYRLISWLCARQAVTETVTTRVRLPMSPEAAWRHIMFYEEVPTRPGFLLRTLLPYPIRTEGPKNAVGALVRCAYRGGDLVKRITTIEHHTCWSLTSSSSGWASSDVSRRSVARIGWSAAALRARWFCVPPTAHISDHVHCGGGSRPFDSGSFTSTFCTASKVPLRNNDRRVGASAKGVGELR